MHQPGTPESLRHRAARYAIVVAIVLIVGGLFVQREFIADGGGGNVLAQPLELDAPAPDFTLETADGEFRLSDQRGKVVVLNFWASWCAPCRHEMPVFQETYEARAPAGDFMLVAVNVTADDARANADRFVEDFGLTFPVPFDVTRSVANAYGVRGLPATFFIDAAGILRARVYGPLPLDRLEDHIAAAGG
jgi:peroxiredoxin